VKTLYQKVVAGGPGSGRWGGPERRKANRRVGPRRTNKSTDVTDRREGWERRRALSHPGNRARPGSRKWLKMTPQQRSDQHFKDLVKREGPVRRLREARRKK
jgi:hypothetical protein